MILNSAVRLADARTYERERVDSSVNGGNQDEMRNVSRSVRLGATRRFMGAK